MSKDGSYNGNPRIKGDSVTQQFTQEEILEYKKCMNDVAYFCEKYVKVIHLDHGLVPFKLRGYQEELMDHFNDHRFGIVLACRQSGKSITSVAWLLHYVLFNPYKKIGILANKGATAREMLGRFTLMLENLPFFLQPGVKILNKGNIIFSHNSEIIAAATSSDSIRGLAMDVIFLDEFAFVKRSEEFYTSTYPVISSGANTKVIITSTPNGMGNMFYKIWDGAVNSSNEFKPFKIDWKDVPGRDEAWKKQTIDNTSELQFRQEFGVEFIGSSQTLIDTNTLLALSSKDPITVQHGIHFYEKPVEDHEYVLVADVSKGRGQDFSTFSVIDISSAPFKQVCTYRDNLISPLLFPTIILRAAMAYNESLVIVENNDAGQVVCNSLYYEHEYENTFVTSSVKSDGIGVTMTAKVKRIGCSNFKDLVESGQITINDFHTISEMTTFEPKGSSFAASAGTHDDSIMNFVLFSWFISTDYFKSISDIQLKEMLYNERIMEMEEDLVPFGYTSNKPAISDVHASMVEDLNSWKKL